MKRVLGLAALFMVLLAPASPTLVGAIASLEPASPKLVGAVASLEPASPKLVGDLASEGGHEHFRIVGLITKLSTTEMDVKNKERKTYTVDINKKTVVKRDKEKTELDLSALKVGQTVVVDAYGDDEFDLEALDIRIVPPIGSPR